MAWSKSTRISVMLGIDIVFFLVELIVGLLVHSLALLADAFHMVSCAAKKKRTLLHAIVFTPRANSGR